jgi:hypothetical protein
MSVTAQTAISLRAGRMARPKERQIVVRRVQALADSWQQYTTSGENTVKKGSRSCQHGGRRNPAPAATGVLRHLELL